MHRLHETKVMNGRRDILRRHCIRKLPRSTDATARHYRARPWHSLYVSVACRGRFGHVLAAVLSFVAVLAATQRSAVATDVAGCLRQALRVVVEKTQGTAGQSVAFLAVVNRARACRLSATASLTVARNGARIRSINGNPATLRINRSLGHGTTWLLAAWWANWCGKRSGSFSAQGVVGSLAASGPYSVLPACLDTSLPSRLRGSRYPSVASAR